MTERTDRIVEAMTAEERASLTAGIDLWRTPPIGRLGVPAIKMTDGPIGARGDRYTGGPTSTCFPNGSALAATWDVDLLERVGAALGEAARAKGAHVLLGPTVNLHRTPLGGRHFECFSEDPHLSARMAVAYVRGVQAQGVAACVKHLVANDAETERFTASSDVDERVLRELYLVPFEAALVEAGAWAVMGAYNKLNGTWCCEHPWLLGDVLRDEWHWDGLVVSDWWATHSSVAAAEAGLDVEMPGPPLHLGPNLVGAVADEVVDEKVRRLLLLAERTGALDAAAPTVEASDDSPRMRSLAREAATSAIVLLQDHAGLLPLDEGSLTSVAVVGPNADATEVLGGGSAYVVPPYTVSILDGLRARLGDRIVHETGVRSSRGTPRLDLRRLQDGLRVEHLVDGEVVDEEVAGRSSLRWHVLDPTGWSVRVTGTYVPAADGDHRFLVRSAGSTVLSVAGGRAEGTGRVEDTVELVSGEPVPLEVEWAPVGDELFTGLELRCAPPLGEDAFERAVAAAAAADVAVVVVGLDGEWETEGRDRDDLALPGGQADLVRAVAAANPRTVVIVNAGAPVDLTWADDVPAVLWAWYGGQEAGNAVADVLLGDADPAGRLPTTLWDDLSQVPSHVPVDGHVSYDEGLAIGYRRVDQASVAPRFPFGHGLSYARFEYGEVALSPARVAPGQPVQVGVEVANSGDRPGVEVVQVYVAAPEASVPRPPKELRGFAKVRLEPGARTTVTLELDGRARSYWDPAGRCWQEEPGRFEVLVGRSADDIRGTAAFVVDTAG